MSKTSASREIIMNVEIIREGDGPIGGAYGELVREAFRLTREELGLDGPSQAPPVSRPASLPVTDANVRVIYGACPKCHNPDVRTLPDGDPLCLVCAWAGQTIPGELVPVEPEGEPMSYETSVTFFEDYKRRSEEHRAKKRDAQDRQEETDG